MGPPDRYGDDACHVVEESASRRLAQWIGRHRHLRATNHGFIRAHQCHGGHGIHGARRVFRGSIFTAHWIEWSLHCTPRWRFGMCGPCSDGGTCYLRKTGAFAHHFDYAADDMQCATPCLCLSHRISRSRQACYWGLIQSTGNLPVRPVCRQFLFGSWLGLVAAPEFTQAARGVLHHGVACLSLAEALGSGSGDGIERLGLYSECRKSHSRRLARSLGIGKSRAIRSHG